jgi:hypothetical protein
MLLFPRPSFSSQFAAYGAPAGIAQRHAGDREESLLDDFFMGFGGGAPPVLDPLAFPDAPAVGDFLLAPTRWQFHHDLTTLACLWSLLTPWTQDRWDQAQCRMGQRQEPLQSEKPTDD